MSTLTGDSHYFFWWMGTWISEKIEELFQKHEEMWKHAKGGDRELWLAKLFVTRKCDHPYDKRPGMKGPVLAIIPGTICILQPCPEVSQLATYPGQATWLHIETSTRPVFRPLEGNGEDGTHLRISQKRKRTWHQFLPKPLVQKYQSLWKLLSAGAP